MTTDESKLSLAKTVRDKLRTFDELPPVVLAVIEAVEEAASGSCAKYKKLCQRVSSDDRLRGSYVFNGASTGRFSGRGFQPQNLPRDINPRR